jgi:phage regulator Rha-like protein
MARRISTPAEGAPAPVELVERRIYFIRGQKVMLDADLAELYQVQTRALNQAVRRNPGRFPEDFMFQLTEQEASALRSQIVTLEKGRGRYSKYAPLAFTEHGVAMLSSALSSERAVQMNITIIRAFIRLREALASNQELSARLERGEAKLRQHGGAIALLADEIRKLKQPPPLAPKRSIGFLPERK